MMETTVNPTMYSSTSGTADEINKEMAFHDSATSFDLFKIGEGINRTYFMILIPAGLLGNTLSFLVMTQKHNRTLSLSLYISALAVSDTVGLLVGLMRYLNEVYGVYMPPDQFWHCTIVAVTLTTATLCSSLFIVSMTFDRFYSIIRPHKAASFNTVKRAKLSIFFIIFVSIVCNIPHAFLTTYAGGQCLPYGKAIEYTFGQIYYYFSNVLNWVFPFVSLLIMNSFIIHTLRKRLKSNLGTAWGESQGQDQGPDQGQGQSIRLKSSEKQVFTLLLLVTFGFLVLTTPMYALSVYTKLYDYIKTPYSFAGFYLFYSVAQKAYYTNFGINFYLYVISGQKFRSDLLRLINGQLRQCKTKALQTEEKNYNTTEIDIITSCTDRAK